MSLIILFDEQGTPTFNIERETDFFLGIGAAYDESIEKSIFDSISELFGLKKSKPLKNRNISSSKAVEISKVLSSLPILIDIAFMDLSNSKFHKIVTEYEEKSSAKRNNVRRVRKRPISQILHTFILDGVLFELIAKSIQKYSYISIVKIYMDNWSMPKSDKGIALKYRSESLQKNIRNVLTKIGIVENSIEVKPIQLLQKDSYRKRFIDVIASVVSRAFLERSNKRFSEEPLKNILIKKENKMKDITERTIGIMNNLIGNDFFPPANFEVDQ